VRGRHVAPTVTAWVVPGSEQVRLQAQAEGLDRVFLDSGFEWRAPGCSLCVAAQLAGPVADWRTLHNPGLPLFVMVAPPADYVDLNGARDITRPHTKNVDACRCGGSGDRPTVRLMSVSGDVRRDESRFSKNGEFQGCATHLLIATCNHQRMPPHQAHTKPTNLH
jgi:hypothetical protein